ncbi:hypothetical protein YWIDRAFT_02480 [Streptomyces sp. SceaMP-e96]|nr:hypothetical protein YWIDRAFT_02480 [Streptomyces sp. SceaMP-e96]
MSVIWVSCHMGANAVKGLHLKIEALRYGCCVSCKGCVKFRGRRLLVITTADGSHRGAGPLGEGAAQREGAGRRDQAACPTSS